MDKQAGQGSQNSISLDEIYAGIDYDNNVSVVQSPDGTDMVVLEEDFENGLKAIHKFVDRVLSTPGPAFRIGASKGCIKVFRTRLSTIPTSGFITQAFRDTYELSEQIKIFFEAESELGLRSEVWLRTPRAKCWLRAQAISADLANEFVGLIRQKAANREFRRRLAVRRFAVKSNFKRGADLIEGLFATKARINVVRIDLEYRCEHRPTLQQIKMDFARFLNNARRNSLFDSTIAVIWRLECAIRTGYHVHAMLFLDGDDARHDGYIAQQIGNYWEEITEGRGRFENCNYDKNKYKRLGIGMIHCSETEPGGKRDVLVNTVLHYITMVDELARPRVPKGTRTFGASRMPEPHSGKGRKRLEHDRTLRSV